MERKYTQKCRKTTINHITFYAYCTLYLFISLNIFKTYHNLGRIGSYHANNTVAKKRTCFNRDIFPPHSDPVRAFFYVIECDFM